MEKIILSVRLTETFFSKAELTRIKAVLATYNSKSEFIRDIIKLYLDDKQDKSNRAESEEETIKQIDLSEIKQLLKENNQLLKDFKLNPPVTEKKAAENNQQQEVYQGTEQLNKTNKMLNLLEQF